MLQLIKRWCEPAFFFDIAQAVVALILGFVLALDMTDLWSSPWLSKNLPYLTFIAVCVLIVSAFLERKITLERLQTQQEELSRLMSGFPPARIKFQGRGGYTMPVLATLLIRQGNEAFRREIHQVKAARQEQEKTT